MGEDGKDTHDLSLLGPFRLGETYEASGGGRIGNKKLVPLTSDTSKMGTISSP